QERDGASRQLGHDFSTSLSVGRSSHAPRGREVMSELPGGTVTFLFTDVEGSTRLLQQLGDRYPAVLEEHRCLLRAAFQQWGGHELGTEGDGCFAVFARAAAAAAAAVDAQRALAAHPWPEGASVRVRMGLHTGEATLAHGEYVGLDV